MSDKRDVYTAIAARERASRIEAERLLEVKSRELYTKKNELEKSARELGEANALLSEIMAVAPNGIILCTQEYVIRDVNPTCLRRLKTSKSNMVGKRLGAFFDDIETRLNATPQGEFFIDCITTQPVAGDAFSSEVRGFSGAIAADCRFLIFFHDITDRLLAQERRMRVEKQMDEARRLEAIGTLSAGIAHEINTPIQFIGDNLDYLRDALAKIHHSYLGFNQLYAAARKNEQYNDLISSIDAYNHSVALPELISEISEALQESRDGIHQVRDIVLLMKEFAHPGGWDAESVDLNKIVENVIKLSRSRLKGAIEIKLEKAEDLPEIQGRRGQIQQVILNIVMNALDAVEDSDRQAGLVCIRTWCDGDFAKIAISDTGAGVSEELKEKIFNPFFTTKPVGKGTGQGLALAKDCVVKGHNGRLGLIDRDGFTTTFLIELPLINDPSKAQTEQDDVYAA